MAGFDPPHDLQKPGASLAAGGAFSARFVLEKFHQVHGGPDHAGILIHHGYPARSEHGADLRDRFKIHLRVEMLRRQKGSGGPARDHRFQSFVASDPPRMFVDHLPKGNPQGHFIIAGALDMAADGEDPGPWTFLRSNRGIPLRPSVNNVGDVCQGLDVVHHRRLLIKPVDRRKRRLGPRLSPLSFDRFEQRGLLPANIGASAPVKDHLQIKPAPENILSEQPGVIRFLNRPLDHLRPEIKLSPDVNVGLVRPDRIGADPDSLQHLVRILID